MKDDNAIKNLLENSFPDAEVVKLSGIEGHFELLLVSGQFENQAMVERHKRIYQVVGSLIADQAIHAISIRALTPKEYKALNIESS